LGSNSLMGEVPSFLGNLVQLKYLSLGGNMLIGQIPSSLGNLVQLTSLDLSYNQLTGEIPSSIGNLVQLVNIDLGYNLLLKFLVLSSNQLSGEIPSLLGRLTQLIDVDLSFNQFHGAIPSTIFQLQGLSILDLSSNNLSGIVKLDTFSEAKTFDNLYYPLTNCHFFLHRKPTLFEPFWQLPNKFCSRSRYFQVERTLCSRSRFQRVARISSYSPPEIQYYFISNNRLSGGISPLICNLSSIQMIDLSDNNLTGFLPQCLSNLSGTLEVMSLQSNNFIGKIPQLNGNFHMIDLSYNKLHGPLPRSLRNCNDLEFLNFGNNQIRDVFPSWLGSLLRLKVLILRYNRFHGFIGEPADRIEFPMLQIIDLSHNSFSGSLPSKYFKHWTAMKVSETNLSDYIGHSNGSIWWDFSPFATFDYSMR
ncbi:hypothetical protein NL676_017741, partial [Syzygium grande]